MEKEYVLIVFDSNWADEVDIEGFKIVKKEYWENVKLGLEHGDDLFPFSYSIGTNQEDEINTKEEFLRTFRAKEITEGEVSTLMSLLNKYESKNPDFFEFGLTFDLDEFDYRGRQIKEGKMEE